VLALGRVPGLAQEQALGQELERVPGQVPGPALVSGQHRQVSYSPIPPK